MMMTASRIRFILHPIVGRKTTCRFAITIDDIPAWPAHGSDDVFLTIQIDDLLGYLAEYWKPLMLRQVYPIDVHPTRPSELRREAERRWEELPQTIIETEAESVADFEEAQDLASCFAGYSGLPAFWILRSGHEFAIESGNTLWKLPSSEVHTQLTLLGDRICDRLAQLDNERWKEAIEAWRRRNEADQTVLLAWSAGVDRSLAKELIEENVLEAPRNFDDALADDDELRIAARMAGALSPEQIREVVGLARAFGPSEAKQLRNLAQKTSTFIAAHHENDYPFRQGEAAASFVREYLELPSDHAVDIFDLLSSLGLDLRYDVADPATLDGLAIWGRRHGPGVFLNAASRRILGKNDNIAQSPGARITLAHEFCHFLLDGGHALSAVEVLKARMPPGVERRAKSFAGEFLLPRAVAAQRWNDAGRPIDSTGLNIVLQDLAETFGVTWSVAAWKLQHAVQSAGMDLSRILDVLAPFR